MSLKLIITVFLIFSFAGGALLSFVIYHKNNEHHNVCPITNAQGGLCPSVAGGMASAVFYMRAFGIFFAAVFFALSIAWFYEGFFDTQHKPENILSAFFNFSFLVLFFEFLSKISTIKFTSWLAFHEESPCLA